MIGFTYKDLFDDESVRKQVELTIEGVDEIVTNDSIHTESLRLQESLCSEQELRFGGCIASQLEIKLVNHFGDLTGKTVECNIAIGSDTDTLLALGTFKVAKCELSADKSYIKITAYDVLYDIIQSNVATWYNNLTFPISIKELRDDFFRHLGIEQEETSLIQDDIMIDKTIDGDTVSGLDVIKNICEINAVFGKIGRDGSFTYISLEPTIQKEYKAYRSCEYEDFCTLAIDKVQIREETDDIGAICGSGDNTYIIQGNFLLYGKTEEELTQIANNFLEKAQGITYLPYKAKVIGNPCVEVGDYISIVGRTATVYSYVLNRELSGIQSLADAFTTDGALQYSEIVTSNKAVTNQIKGKVSKLTRSLGGLTSEVHDLAAETSTKFEQTAESINAKVDKGGVVSEINQSAEEIKIKADKISLEGTITANGSFTINKDGTMSSSGGKLGNWEIENGALVGRSAISHAYYRNALYLEPPTSYTSYGTPMIYTMSENTHTGDKEIKFALKSNGEVELGDVALSSIQDRSFGDVLYHSTYNYTDTSDPSGDGISQELSGINRYLLSDSNDYTNKIQIGNSDYNPGTEKGVKNMYLYAYDIEVLAPIGGASFHPSMSSSQTLGNANHLWSTIYARNTTISTSDRRLKENIEPISDKYIDFFMELEPCTYKFKDAENARTHVGYIAQDVESTMYRHGIADMDFAGLCKDEKVDADGNTDYSYALRYSEFIALNTAIIQKQQKEIDKLKEEIATIKACIGLE